MADSLVSHITLRDGRKLGFSEFGAPDGTPVINHHGGLVGRLDIAPAHETARELGIRIISPDRPGIGESDPQPERTLETWAQDVRELADQLGLERFAALGWSMGGQYALATCFFLRARVKAVAVIAGVLPLDDAKNFDALNKLDRRFSMLAEHAPEVAAALFVAMGELAQREPQAWNNLMARTTVPVDAEAIRRQPLPGMAGAAAPALLHGMGMVTEYRTWRKPWGFGLGDIAVPVSVWQGDADELISPVWGEELAKQIPGARLHMLNGEGHILAYNHYGEILGEMVDGRRTVDEGRKG